MHLDVPFVFHIGFVPKGKRTPQHTAARASVPVEIATTDGTLAFEIGCPFVHKSYKTPHVSPFHAPPGETVRVYRAEETYWTEICSAKDAQRQISDRRSMPRDPFDVMLKLGERNYADAGMSDIDEGSFKSRHELEKEHDALRSWDESGRDRIAAVLHRRAAEDMRIIDGRLCMRVSEPVLDTVFHLEAPEAQADGYHLVIDQISPATPAGFTLKWTLPTQHAQRWRIDQTEAAVAFARAEEALRYGRDSKVAMKKGIALAPDPAKLLQPPAITIAFADTSTCKHDGLSGILRRQIDHLRSALVQNAGALDREMLSVALDLQHAFERDGGRLTPALIELGRKAVDLHEAGHVPVDLDYQSAKSVNLQSHSSYGEARASLPGQAEGFRLTLSFWDSRSPSRAEWIDRTLPAPVLPGTDFDVVEMATLQHGQDLVDVGCDPAVLEAFAGAQDGTLHVIAAETVEGRLLGFAAVVCETAEGPVVERVFAPKAPNPEVLERVRERFDAFVAANIDAAAEHDALMGMSLG
jgi:hypothetical protein